METRPGIFSRGSGGGRKPWYKRLWETALLCLDVLGVEVAGVAVVENGLNLVEL
ncbi:MAG: hypothetical protein AB2785_03860 [Candidatus Thiodiazotropha endolucinida]